MLAFIHRSGTILKVVKYINEHIFIQKKPIGIFIRVDLIRNKNSDMTRLFFAYYSRERHIIYMMKTI
jgi:hypothetical protein